MCVCDESRARFNKVDSGFTYLSVQSDALNEQAEPQADIDLLCFALCNHVELVQRFECVGYQSKARAVCLTGLVKLVPTRRSAAFRKRD